MNKEVRLKVEMGTHALEFSVAHPDTEPAMQATVSKLEQLLEQVNEAAVQQRDGVIQARAAAALKHELRRKMLDVGIAHLAEVGRAAARERQELGKTFRFNPEATTLVAFRTAARSMLAAADEHQETLAKFGKVQSMVDELKQQLDQFEAALKQASDGRSSHVAATIQLRAVSQEIVRTVRVMDGRNRQRFADDPQLLGAWLNVSTVHGRSRGGSDVAAAPSDGAPPGRGRSTAGRVTGSP